MENEEAQEKVGGERRDVLAFVRTLSIWTHQLEPTAGLLNIDQKNTDNGNGPSKRSH